jgi:flagellar basal-body rod modification protein FlgD
MAVTGITSGYGAVVGAEARDSQNMDQTMFLQLLIKQIQNQDPLSPMDNQEFIAQLAAFANLEQMQGINDRLDDNLALAQGMNNTMMLSLVGKDVTVRGDTLNVSDGEVSRNQILTDYAGNATVTVRNAAGQTVATYHAAVRAGFNDLTWDGKLRGGEDAPDGDYSLEIDLASNNGAALDFIPLMTAPVEGLRYENGVAIVEVAGSDYYVSEIYEIRR